jgi:hypothetical protein
MGCERFIALILEGNGFRSGRAHFESLSKELGRRSDYRMQYVVLSGRRRE